MTDYRTFVEEHRRLTILRVLHEAPGYEANESLLHDLVERFGLRATRDQVRGDIVWLGEQGLVTFDRPGDLMIATITKRGSDVATGRASVPGVRRPSPGS